MTEDFKQIYRLMLFNNGRIVSCLKRGDSYIFWAKGDVAWGEHLFWFELTPNETRFEADWVANYE